MAMPDYLGCVVSEEHVHVSSTRAREHFFHLMILLCHLTGASIKLEPFHPFAPYLLCGIINSPYDKSIVLRVCTRAMEKHLVNGAVLFIENAQ